MFSKYQSRLKLIVWFPKKMIEEEIKSICFVWISFKIKEVLKYGDLFSEFKISYSQTQLFFVHASSKNSGLKVSREKKNGIFLSKDPRKLWGLFLTNKVSFIISICGLSSNRWPRTVPADVAESLVSVSFSQSDAMSRLQFNVKKCACAFLGRPLCWAKMAIT